MTKVLLATREKSRFSDMMAAFQSHGVHIDPVQSSVLALKMIEDGLYDLLIVDESLSDLTGRDLVEKAVILNPLMNTVAVSTLSHEDFHEAFEGMGVLMQFPPEPGTADVQNVLDHLDKLYTLSNQ